MVVVVVVLVPDTQKVGHTIGYVRHVPSNAKRSVRPRVKTFSLARKAKPVHLSLECRNAGKNT